MISIDDFKKLDLRVAEVVKAELHPDADRLLLLTVRVGEGERLVVAGIRKSYSPEELIGKRVVVVCNLEPTTIRGVQSDGMILATTVGDQVVLLVPDKDAPAGSVVR